MDLIKLSKKTNNIQLLLFSWPKPSVDVHYLEVDMCLHRHCQAELLYKVSETLILSISQPLFATSAHRHLNWINLGYTDRCRGPVKWAPDGVFTRHSLPVCLLHFTPGWQGEVTTGANLSAVFQILNTLLLLFFRCRIFYYMHLGHDIDGLNTCGCSLARKRFVPFCCFGLELVNGKVESFEH